MKKLLSLLSLVSVISVVRLAEAQFLGLQYRTTLVANAGEWVKGAPDAIATAEFAGNTWGDNYQFFSSIGAGVNKPHGQFAVTGGAGAAPVKGKNLQGVQVAATQGGGIIQLHGTWAVGPITSILKTDISIFPVDGNKVSWNLSNFVAVNLEQSYEGNSYFGGVVARNNQFIFSGGLNGGAQVTFGERNAEKRSLVVRASAEVYAIYDAYERRAGAYCGVNLVLALVKVPRGSTAPTMY